MTSPLDLTFDLTRERWIPVLGLDGRPRELSPVEVFASAGELSSIGGELPTTGFALTRLLLAVLHRATEGPRDLDHWAELWAQPGLPVSEVEAYLDRWRDRFDLFSATTPFHQVAGLSTGKGVHSGLEKVIADVPNGLPLFSTRSGRALTRIGPAEAARWLVHVQNFDTSGIKTGVVGDSRMKGGRGYPDGVAWAGNTGGFLVEGPSLRETLLLNLLPYDAESDEIGLQWGSPADDVPVWERAPLGPDVELDRRGIKRERPVGPADLYTWSSRRVRLVGNTDGVTGLVLSYGDRLPQQDAHTFEPMSSWRRSDAQQKALKRAVVYMPRQHSADRVFWRGLEAVLPVAQQSAAGREPPKFLPPATLAWLDVAARQELVPADLTVRTRATGIVYGAQSAVVEELIDDQLSSRVAALRAGHETLGEQVVVAVRRCEEAVLAVKNLAGNLVRAAGGDGDGARERAEETAFAALDGPFRRWVASLGPGSALLDVQTSWQLQVRVVVAGVADELVEASGESAWKGRLVMGRHVDAGIADAWFRAALRKALPLAVVPDVRRDPVTDEEVA